MCLGALRHEKGWKHGELVNQRVCKDRHPLDHEDWEYGICASCEEALAAAQDKAKEEADAD